MAQDDVAGPDAMSLDPGYVARSQAPELVQKAARWDSSDPRRLAMSPWQYDPQEGKVHWATPHSITGPVSGLAQAMMHLTDAIHGVYHPAMDPKGAINDALSVAAAAIPAGAAAPRGAIGMFAGAGAKTANHDSLAMAKSMEDAVGPSTIWHTTGWMKGPDGQWKHEISDQGAKLGPAVEPVSGGGNLVKLKPVTNVLGNHLGDVLDHPALYEAYPELADLPVSRVPLQHIMSMKGAAAQDGSRLYLAPDKPEDFLSTTLHEVQHIIQHKEGFGIGGSPSEWWTPYHAEALSQLKSTQRNLRDVADQLGYNPHQLEYGMLFPGEKDAYTAPLEKFKAEVPDLHAQYQETLDGIDALTKQHKEAVDTYHGLAGEVEARNVQERKLQGLDAETPPWQTQGYPTGPQTVRFTHRDGMDGAAQLPAGQTLEQAQPSDLNVTHLGGMPMEELEELEEVPQIAPTMEGAGQ